MRKYPDSIRVGGFWVLRPNVSRVEHERKEDGFESPAKTKVFYVDSAGRDGLILIYGKEADQWWSDFLTRLDIEDDPELMEVVL